MGGNFCRRLYYAVIFAGIGLASVSYSSSGWAFGKSAVAENSPLPAPSYPLKDRVSLLHSHNDYERESPLFSALASRFDSVEADLWQVWDKILISHDGFTFKGSLRELYLDPLQKRVDELGSVYGDGKPFYLWLDLKDFSYELVDLLQVELARYSMFTVFRDGTEIAGPVIVVLTGNDWLKKHYASKYSVRFATRDSNKWDKKSAPVDNRWQWYALSWKDFFQWNGIGEMPAVERTKLQNLVSDVHARGKKLRLWDAPETTRVWNECIGARVDMLGTDRLLDLRMFMDAP